MTHPFWVSEADATFSDQSEPDPLDAEILLLGFRQTGVVSGCDVTQSSGSEMEIDVASGEVLIAGASTTVSAQPDRTIATADGTNPRFDLVTINSSGTVVVTTGTPAVQPQSPDMPDATSVPLAYVYVPASDTTITDNQIHNKRVLLVASSGVSTYFSWNDPDDGSSTSSSAFPWKGAGLNPQIEVLLHGMVFCGSTTQGGDYQGAVITVDGSNDILTIDKTSTYTVLTGDAQLTNATILHMFASPITLLAGTDYWLMVGRTDQSDTFALPVQYPSGDHNYPFSAMPPISSKRVAKANPAIGDPLDDADGVVVRIAALWEIA